MQLYFAISSDEPGAKRLLAHRPPNLLATYAYPKIIEYLTYPPERLIIDSGAFSAWNSGYTISLLDYLTFAVAVKKRYPHATFVNLDVIPGEVGRSSTEAERHHGMRASVQNADRLRAAGLTTIEVFHQDEPFAFLDTLISRSNDGVIGLSPRNDLSVQKRTAWLRSVLTHLLRTHTPDTLPKFHGLAVTGRGMLEAFPFYSADSSSWQSASRYGSFMNPHTRKTNHTSQHFPSSRPAIVRTWGEGQSIKYFFELESYITRLWEKRGITWNK